MEKILARKVALVTGGTRGIGHAIAERLLVEGASVALCSPSEQHVAKAQRELQSIGPVLGISADVSKLDQVRNFFHQAEARFGGVDILVNNAGVGVFAGAADLKPEDWQHMIDLNLSGPFYCAREAIPRMRARGSGYIINISSLAGKNAFAGGAGYNASKFGLNGLSEATMLDHRYDNIRVSYIMPGSVDTDFGSSSNGASWKIAPRDIADIVIALLRLPERTLVSRVEVRPSKPKK